MDGWQSGGTESRGAPSAAGQASVTAVAGVVDAPAHAAVVAPMSGAVEVGDTSLLELLPHPAFAIAVDGDDLFRFIYTNDAYRILRGDDFRDATRGDEMHFGSSARTGDLRSIVPANALVAHVRAFAARRGNAGRSPSRPNGVRRSRPVGLPST